MKRVQNLTIDDFNIIVRTIDDGITIQGPNGALLYANDAAARIIGFASAEVLLAGTVAEIMSAFDVLDEAGQPLAPTELPSRKALEGIAAEAVVRFRVRATSEERWSILKSTPSFNGDGSVKFVINVFQDITERKRSEDALRESHDWLSTTLASIGDAVIATDRHGNVTFLNAVAESVTRWMTADAVGRPLPEIFRIINEETRQIIESPVAKVLREGVIVGLANHTILIRKDETEIAIDDSAAPIKNAHGEIVGVVLVFRDIEDARREQRRQQFVADALAKLSSSLDYAVTLNAVAQLAVPHIADWCAVDVVQEDGSSQQLAVAHIDPAKVELARELNRRYPSPVEAPRGVAEVLRTGKTEWAREISDDLLVKSAVDEEHLRIARALGLRAYIIAPMIARGRVLGALTFVAADRVRSFDARDVRLAETIAERAAVALDNARLFRESERAAALREQLLSIVSHDLRSPLSAIMIGAAAVKRRLTDRPDVVKTIGVMLASAERMEKMIGRLLDFSRASIGDGLPVELRHSVLNDVCSNVLDELRAAHPKVPIVLRAEESIRGAWDPDRIGDVISNLVANAVQYGDGGPVTVSLRRDGRQALIEVHNHGLPISQAVLPHLFDPFRRGTIERKRDGAGLGLFIARSIVTAHRGQIDVDSSADAGTRFRVRLPITPA